jgi:hypothetical protein
LNVWKVSNAGMNVLKESQIQRLIQERTAGG